VLIQGLKINPGLIPAIFVAAAFGLLTMATSSLPARRNGHRARLDLLSPSIAAATTRPNRCRYDDAHNLRCQ